MKICFYAPVESKDLLDRVNFYADDIKILKELGQEVIICNKFKEIPLNCDLYYIWWWTWAFLPLIKAKFKSRPTIITGTFNYDTQPIGYITRPWWQKGLIKFATRFTNVNIFVSKYEMDLVRQHLYVNDPKYVPHVIDIDKYKPTNAPKEPFLLNVAWSGALNGKRKCLKEIIEGFKIISEKYPEYRLKMAGKPGDYHNVLIETANRLDVDKKIDFLGIISEEEKIKLMQSCSIYIQPTLFEGFGVAIAEAMACGAPVLSSPVGAIPEVVGENGVMVDGKKPSDIANGAIKILSDNFLGKKLSISSRKQIEENFAYSRRKIELKNIINELVEKD